MLSPGEVKPLVKTLARVLRRGDNGMRAVAYLAVKRRNADTFNYFERTAVEEGLHLCDITAAAWENRTIAFHHLLPPLDRKGLVLYRIHTDASG